MQLIALDHVNLRTASLDEMVAWYETVLGMRSGARPGFAFPGAWLYVGDKPFVHLVGIGEEVEASDLQIEHFAFSATGFAAFVKRLEDRGIEYRLAPVPGYPIVQVNVWDPDGNHIHIDFSEDEAKGAV